MDINYGGAKDLQLTLVVPASYEGSGRTTVGLGDLELAAKYKVVHQTEGGWLPDIAVFPRLFAPTSGRRFGTDHVRLLLPVWAEKDFGPWSVFGGGGYELNPGAGNRNFWTGGVAVTRKLNERLALGGEVYRQTADAVEARDYTGLNLGLTYQLAKHWALLASGGPGLQNAREGGQFSFYFALLATY